MSERDTFTFLDSAAARIHRELPHSRHATPRGVALLSKKLGWRRRKIYGQVAVYAPDLDAWIIATAALAAAQSAETATQRG